ncbi:GatB/YqeY domain-containing protein [Endozoicomonas sp. SESOKO3]|uniref:GatB/YqeY domain-containing protein n=1 Tax=Endozoicomonas sp. SESOKO3 TaxID=2828744 RepID=UPI00359FDEFD
MSGQGTTDCCNEGYHALSRQGSPGYHCPALIELKRVEVDEKSIDDIRALAALDKMAKQRRDASNQFESAGHPHRAHQEKPELSIIPDFLPFRLSTKEISQLASATIRESGARSTRMIGLLLPQATIYPATRWTGLVSEKSSGRHALQSTDHAINIAVQSGAE